MLTVNQPVSIVYDKGDSKPTPTRRILPVMIPKTYVMAIDITDLPKDEYTSLIETYSEYMQYRKIQMDQVLGFERWLDATRGEQMDLKWRSFTPSKMQLV